MMSNEMLFLSGYEDLKEWKIQSTLIKIIAVTEHTHISVELDYVDVGKLFKVSKSLLQSIVCLTYRCVVNLTRPVDSSLTALCLNTAAVHRLLRQTLALMIV